MGRILKGLLIALLSAAALILIGGALLFSGSEVTCEEFEPEGGTPALRCGFEVAATPEAVWETFTRTDEPQPHYFDAVLQAEMHPGGRWRFVTDDLQRLLADGVVLAVDPPRRFQQTFRAADLEEAPSRITVELEPTATGSRVTLTHDRFPGKTVTYRRFRKAHPLALSAMKARLETGKLPVRARIYTWIFKPGMKSVSARAEPWEPRNRGFPGRPQEN
ncbi:hypothetical protein ABI59_12820 [Acidobacteria bacterium Mor1]|nr:hypothetical protein ABI59_12820 [Acidobacteria bacterium Mor1]